MEKLEWTDDLSTGIKEIDLQHMRILKYINALGEETISHPWRINRRAQIIIEELAEYAVSHFGLEERLMRESGYYAYNAHKKSHERFVSAVVQFKERFGQGEDVTEDLWKFLSTWLAEHIRGEDQGYVSAIQKMIAQSGTTILQDGELEQANRIALKFAEERLQDVQKHKNKLEWTDDLSTGIEEIDNQHKRIVRYINELEEETLYHSWRINKKAEYIIGEMAEYAVSHFGLEEKYMIASGYEDYDQHKKVHDDFVKVVVRFKERFDKGENVAKDMHKFLCYWLIKHIRGEDQGYVDSIQKMLNAKKQEKATPLEKLVRLVFQREGGTPICLGLIPNAVPLQF